MWPIPLRCPAGPHRAKSPGWVHVLSMYSKIMQNIHKNTPTTTTKFPDFIIWEKTNRNPSKTEIASPPSPTYSDICYQIALRACSRHRAISFLSSFPHLFLISVLPFFLSYYLSFFLPFFHFPFFCFLALFLFCFVRFFFISSTWDVICEPYGCLWGS